MSKSKLISLAAIVLLTGFIAKAPAAVVLHWLLPDTVQTRDIEGSIWQGSIAAVSSNGFNAGPVQWRLKPLALVTGKLSAVIEVELPGGFANSDIAWRGQRLWLSDTKAAVDLSALTRFSSIGPSNGRAQVNLSDAELVAFWPTQLQGDLTISNLSYPGVGNAPLGNYSLVFDETQSQLPLTGQLQSLDNAPYELSGTIELGDERSYSMRALIAAKPGVDAIYGRGLQFLGAPDSAGRRALEFDGNL